MADYCQGGRSMYSSMDDCYEAGRHGHGHGQQGQGHGSMRMQSHTVDDYYYDGQDRGRRAPAAYGDDCGYGGRTTAVYSEEYTRKEGYGGEQEYYKREEREHKNGERLGEVGALASGAFALLSILKSRRFSTLKIVSTFRTKLSILKSRRFSTLKIVSTFRTKASLPLIMLAPMIAKLFMYKCMFRTHAHIHSILLTIAKCDYVN